MEHQRQARISTSPVLRRPAVDYCNSTFTEQEMLSASSSTIQSRIVVIVKPIEIKYARQLTTNTCNVHRTGATFARRLRCWPVQLTNTSDIEIRYARRLTSNMFNVHWTGVPFARRLRCGPVQLNDASPPRKTDTILDKERIITWAPESHVGNQMREIEAQNKQMKKN